MGTKEPYLYAITKSVLPLHFRISEQPIIDNPMVSIYIALKSHYTSSVSLGWQCSSSFHPRFARRDSISGGAKASKKQLKSERLWFNDGSCVRLRPQYRRHMWSYDVVADRAMMAKRLGRSLSLTGIARGCLALHVPRQLKSDDVLVVLIDPFTNDGPPAHMWAVNGAEFTAHAVSDWLARIDVKELCIQHGSSWEYGYTERSCGKLRDELLNGEIF